MKSSFQIMFFSRSAVARGVALIAVLAILTVLALIAVVFVHFMIVDSSTGSAGMAKVQADMLARSALEHAQSLLRDDAQAQIAWDDSSESWQSVFAVHTPAESGSTVQLGLPDDQKSRWIYVYKDDNSLVGRYAVHVEDEAGKINVNVAAALSSDTQNEGIGPFEILLTDGHDRGLPVSRDFARNIMQYRYGRDNEPGQYTVDDNLTSASYAGDEIDNNADGIVDESGEGTDEQEEYDYQHPAWDDRAFSTVQEVIDRCYPQKKMAPDARRYLRAYTTVHSRAREQYYDSRDGILRKQVNLNVGTKEQIRRLVRRANEEERFEAHSRPLRSLVANMIDYRDENHVLSTVGGEYGVEAVCFNEVMANDGSLMLEGEGFNPEWAGDPSIRIRFVHQYGKWYNAGGNWTKGFAVESVSAPGGGGSVMMRGKLSRVPQTARVKISKYMIRGWTSGAVGDVYKEFKTILNDNGWKPGMFRNSWLKVWMGNNANPEYIYYPILDNTRDFTLTVGCDNSQPYTYAKLKWAQTNEEERVAVRIDTLWRDFGTTACAFPEQTDFFGYRTKIIDEVTPPESLYYRVFLVINSWNGTFTFPNNYPYQERQITGSYTWKGYNRFFDLDGNPNQQSSMEIVTLKREDLKGSSMELPGEGDSVDMLRFAYLDGKAVRARNGFVPVLVTSDKNTGYVGGMNAVDHARAHRMKNDIDMVQLMRPDIVELINISDQPISLRNWRVVINTGSYADQVGLIENAKVFNHIRRVEYDDPNPVIRPNGYFYLTNNREIFDLEYGAEPNGRWGSTADEAYPCFELPDELWGVRYEITEVSRKSVKVSGAQWKTDQMKYEMVEFHSKTQSEKVNGPTGLRAVVIENTANTLTFQNDFWNLPSWDVKPGDDIIILGMPRQGGFLSMTLKDEYNQVTARTIEYGSTEANEISASTEKFDPTHYTWVKSEVPTFGGSYRRAKNHSLPEQTFNKPYVKNNRYSSIGEIQKVRKASDWENIGMRRDMRASTKELKALTRYFTVSGVRLDPEEPDSHVQGWKPAIGTVRSCKNNVVVTSDCNWELGIWKNQALRVTSGTLVGESFAIVGNEENSIIVDGYSTPGGKILRLQPGDTFSVGPGYATPFFYTRREGDKGVWEWKNKGLERMNYGLYLFGLNDSIMTTEFLEENYNAFLEASVYNFNTREYDRLPLEIEKATSLGARDPYDIITGERVHQYDKQDGVYCGQVSPDHISSDGGIRLRLVARNLQDERNSGFAWFDFAYLSPAAVSGKININTASERVLRALNGMTPEIAFNIYNGIDNDGRKTLKPYQDIADILDVRTVSADLFARICNLITTRSDQFRVRIVAETLKDTDNDGTFNSDTGDKVLAQASIDTVIDRSTITDDDASSGYFKILSLE